MSYYLRLFHGRTDPDRDMEEWGSGGPYIGPISGISWVYGKLRLHSDNAFEFINKVQVDDMISFGGVYYGDFEIRYITGLEEEMEMKNAVPFEEFFELKGNELIKNK